MFLKLTSLSEPKANSEGKLLIIRIKIFRIIFSIPDPFFLPFIKFKQNCHAQEFLVRRHTLWRRTKDSLHHIILSDVGDAAKKGI